MRLLISYTLAAYVAEFIILVIQWSSLRNLWQMSKLGTIMVFPAAIILAPVIRPAGILYQLFRRLL